MERFFRSDNAVMRALSKIFDIAWLSIVYILFCIPIVTAGAATGAMCGRNFGGASGRILLPLRSSGLFAWLYMAFCM